jgi:FkbM family methyltransferase
MLAFANALINLLCLKLRSVTLVVPYQRFYIAVQNNSKIFIPTIMEYHRVQRLRQSKTLRKYMFEPHVVLNRDDVVLDVGAYIGEFSLLAARKARKVIAVEPDPRNCFCLRANVSHLRNVVCIQKAAWKCNKVLKLQLGVKPADSSLINVDGKPLEKNIEVEADCLDNIISDLGVEKVDFLKVDAEGAEPEVLSGAKNLLKTVRNVAVDCSPERFGKPTVTPCVNLLTQAGFKVNVNNENTVFAWK